MRKPTNQSFLARRRSIFLKSKKKLDDSKVTVKNRGVINAAPNHSPKNTIASPPPVSFGAGLVALDWLLIGKNRVRPNKISTGGSCGNVMAILAYLGWKSYPVARLGKDHSAKRLLKDLQHWNVQTDFILREQNGVTPIIVVRLRESENGATKCRFEWRHPVSGEWLPRYRPLPKKTVQGILSSDLPLAKVFYFDRPEPSTLLLAEFMRQQGALVFFEPSSKKDEHLFSSCLAVSDIVKYSAERLPQPPRNPVSKSPRLEIQTLGEAGLRYRLKLNSKTPGLWRRLPSYPIKKLRDTTGCGDWCSAGIISTLCQIGRDEFMKLDESAIVEGLRFGQALAGVKCKFEGARGPMYKQSAEQTIESAGKLLKN